MLTCSRPFLDGGCCAPPSGASRLSAPFPVSLVRSARPGRLCPALSVRGAAPRFASDRPMFVTVAPGVDGRDLARVQFGLDRRARVRLDAVRMGINRSDVRWTRESDLPAGVARARMAAGARHAGGLVRHAADRGGERRPPGVRRKATSHARPSLRAGRPGARRRGRFHAALVSARGADGTACAGGCCLLHPHVPARRPRA